MLDIAINHIDELKKKFNSIWFQEKYKFYNYDMWFNNVEVDDNTWNRHQFASVNKDGEVIGYIAYQVERQTHNASKLAIINFTDDKIVFGRDLKQVLVDIFEKFKFNKLSFSVVVGNPIEKSYDKMVKKYGGCVVGVAANETKLYDNEYYPVKYYEILKENYLMRIYPELYKSNLYIYNCAKTILTPPKNLIKENCTDEYKTSVQVDDCISEEIKDLWSKGIKTTGCCCGHGMNLGFIQVTGDCIKDMEKLGYDHYVYRSDYGGIQRNDAFIPKSYGHNYVGFSNGHKG